MSIFAVVKTGGKQYLVKEGKSITVDSIEAKDKEKIELDTLAIFDIKGSTFELGTPYLTRKVSAEVTESGKGEKIRIARFKAKSRFRKVRGFRPHLTTLKIIKI